MVILDEEDYVFIYKTCILVRALYEANIYVEDKEEVMNRTEKIMKTLEMVYPKLKGLMV